MASLDALRSSSLPRPSSFLICFPAQLVCPSPLCLSGFLGLLTASFICCPPTLRSSCFAVCSTFNSLISGSLFLLCDSPYTVFMFCFFPSTFLYSLIGSPHGRELFIDREDEG